MGNGIDRCAALDSANVKSGFRLFGNFEARDLFDRTSQSVNRTGQSESAVTVSTGAAISHAIARHPDCAVCDVEACAVYGNEMGCPSFHFAIEKMAHAAKIAQPLFADIGDEDDRAFGFDPGLIEGLDTREDHGQPAAIIADAGNRDDVAAPFNLEFGLFGKDCVEMRSKHEYRGRPIPSGAFSDDVADLVNPHVFQSQLDKTLFEVFGASGFFKGRSGDLTDFHLFINRTGFDGSKKFEGTTDLRIFENLFDICPNGLCKGLAREESYKKQRNS